MSIEPEIRFSVIIPVYNAEKTLRRCVDSLLRQDCSEVELILVNDGSKDGSLEICREYARQYDCVRVIDKPNGGVSTARNAGLDAAQGIYVLFVDSDDYVSPSMFEDIGRLLAEGDWDLIRLSKCFDDGKTLEKVVASKVVCHTRKDAMPKLIEDICSKALNPPWAKVYRRELLAQRHIRFPVGVSVAEDRAFNIIYSLYVQSYRVSDQIAYYVNTENENSLSRKRHADLDTQFKIANEYTDQAILESGIPEAEQEQYQRAINFAECRYIYKIAKDLRRDQLGWLERQAELWKRCSQINRKHMSYPHTGYCRRITLPVRFRMTMVIDLIAKRLLK